MRFAATHVVRSGVFQVAAPSDRVFPFFTPEGERSWVPGWEPEYLHPADGTLQPGLVFRTRAGGELTLWLVVHLDTARFEVVYARVTPESRMGTVTVRCDAGAPGVTDVHVTYALTALSEEGNAAVEAFTEAAYERMLTGWSTAVRGKLGARSEAQRGSQAAGERRNR